MGVTQNERKLCMLLDRGSHDVKGEVGVLLGDAHRRLHPEDVAGEAALSDQQLHVFAVLPKNKQNMLLGVLIS